MIKSYHSAYMESNIQILWDIMSCQLTNSYQNLKDCTAFKIFVTIYCIPINMAWQMRWPETSATPLRETKILHTCNKLRVGKLLMFCSLKHSNKTLYIKCKILLIIKTKYQAVTNIHETEPLWPSWEKLYFNYLNVPFNLIPIKTILHYIRIFKGKTITSTGSHIH